MKTVLQWLAEIEDEGIRAEAVCNAVEAGKAWDGGYGIAEAISYSFCWYKTPQGSRFWAEVCLYYEDAEIALKRLNDKNDKIVGIDEMGKIK